MKIPLIPDKKDPMWMLFYKVIKVIDSRDFEGELGRNGLKNVKNHRIMIKIILLSIFFKLDVSDVYNQVNNRPRLSKFLNIKELLSLKQVRELYSRL